MDLIGSVRCRVALELSHLDHLNNSILPQSVTSEISFKNTYEYNIYQIYLYSLALCEKTDLISGEIYIQILVTQLFLHHLKINDASVLYACFKI